MLSLQRQGRAVTYAPLLGEEATQIGSAAAMRKDDLFVPNFRQHGVFIARGMPLDTAIHLLEGLRGGQLHTQGGRAASRSACLSARQMLHAAGIAFAQKYNKTGAAVIVYVGDGGTSEGDFYEALNFAGVFKVPLITDNREQPVGHISAEKHADALRETLAQKGIAAGIKCVQVDGNDVMAVFKAVSEAIDYSNNGPTLIECVTYRMSMHTTADDPTKYRSDDEVAAWKAKDPIERVRKYLISKSLVE